MVRNIVFMQIPHFLNLSYLARFLLVIAYGNSYCKGGCRTVKKVFID